MQKHRFSSFIVGILLVLGISLGNFAPVMAQEDTPPHITNHQVVLYAKTSATVEVNQYVRWTETTPRDSMSMILDAWSGDFGYSDITVYSDNKRVFGATLEDQGVVGDSGAMHRFLIRFAETTVVGGDYELAIGYGSRLNVYPIQGKDGIVLFNWTSAAWPFPVDRFEIAWVAQTMPADPAYLPTQMGEWNSITAFDSSGWYGSSTMAFKLEKTAIPANWVPFVEFPVLASFFGVSTSTVEPTAAAPAPTTVAVATSAPQPTVFVPAPEVSQPQSGGNGWLIVIVLVFVVVGLALVCLFV